MRDFMDKKTIKSVSQGVLGGYGLGVITQTLFTVASGTTITLMGVLGGPLVLVLTAIGFGLGLGSE
jgi:hypothetical protein